MAQVIVRQRAKNQLAKILKLIYFYRPRLKQVVIVTIWDQRMNPETLKKRL